MKKVLNKNNILKGAGVLLIAAVMILSTAAIANTINKKNPTIQTFEEGCGPTTIQPILWDNGMNYLGLAAAQFDEVIPFDAFQADDFLFDESTDVYDVHWIGGYWSTDYATGAFDWGISFMVDDGTGNAPLGHPQTPSFAGPFYFTWNDITKTLLEDTGSSIYYELGVDLPDNLLFAGGEKYWISIWGVGLFPPQSGWGYHEDPILLHQAVGGSDYFPWVFWTNSEDIFGFAHDQCFQLTGEGEPAIPDLDCDGVLNWEDIEPGSTVTGEFTVENIGDPDSLLDWEIESYPDWGNWTFDPPAGTGLKPEDGPVTVDVEVVAPDEPETEFEGEVKIVNSDDPADFCIVEVALATPVNQEPTGLFDWVFLRGLVFNPREDGSRINARAINLHYVEITPQGLRRGVVRLKTVSFRNGVFIKMSEKGLLGNMVRISGFCHGGIEIQ